MSERSILEPLLSPSLVANLIVHYAKLHLRAHANLAGVDVGDCSVHGNVLNLDCEECQADMAKLRAFLKRKEAEHAQANS
jgi:hypothetical protein